eukprot:gene13533-19403_t
MSASEADPEVSVTVNTDSLTEGDVSEGPSSKFGEADGTSEQADGAGVASELKEKGNNCFQSHMYDKAIEHYSAALRIMKRGGEEGRSNLEEAVLLLCKRYISRPARRSEHNCLYGLDPTHLAQLSLMDATRAVDLDPDWPKAYSCKYHEAREVYLQGLSLEPANKGLQDGLADVEKVIKEGATQIKRQRVVSHDVDDYEQRVASRDVDDFECILCLKLLYEPGTTSCGHTFCRGCFARVMDHSNRCPMCRTVLHTGRELPITVTLANIISKNFPEEYEERKLEEGQAVSVHEKTEAGSGNAVCTLPLFVMSTMFPGETSALNIFEPRYRLLVRRAMEGNRKIGMAQVRRQDGQIEDIVMESEIVECDVQPDGRYAIELKARRRMELVGDTTELDGYRVARARPVVDLPPSEEEATILPTLVEEVAQQADTLLARLRSFTACPASNRQPYIRAMLARAGPRPSTNEAENMSFWVSMLLVNFSSTCNQEDKTRLMRMTSTVQRLRCLKMKMAAFPAGTEHGGGGQGQGSCCVINQASALSLPSDAAPCINRQIVRRSRKYCPVQSEVLPDAVRSTARCSRKYYPVQLEVLTMELEVLPDAVGSTARCSWKYCRMQLEVLPDAVGSTVQCSWKYFTLQLEVLPGAFGSTAQCSRKHFTVE